MDYSDGNIGVIMRMAPPWCFLGLGANRFWILTNRESYAYEISEIYRRGRGGLGVGDICLALGPGVEADRAVREAQQRIGRALDDQRVDNGGVGAVLGLGRAGERERDEDGGEGHGVSPPLASRHGLHVAL